MAMKQQPTPFQLRNPYRLDRPNFDAVDVVETALSEEEEAHKYQHSYFSNSWLQSKRSTQLLTKQRQQQQQQTPQPPIPTITITYHIDTHAELTFERHVEWLTQTALWWDMPVVYLYPVPETPVSLEYVETAASRFGSWVNFVKIPPGENSRLGPATMAIKSANPGRVKGSWAKMIAGRKKATAMSVVAPEEEDDTLVDEGMVMGHSRKGSASSTASSTLFDPSRNVDLVVGYVFVGSADEQAQYSQVFDTMERLYPMIEIRYINSFEPQHLQSRQQQVLREEPCLHSLSWIHYWTAAKESQVLQSRIVNEVVRVRPMWVNNELLHRNYTPPPQFSTKLLTANAAEAAVEDFLECFSPSPDNSVVLSSPSVYIGNGSDGGDDANDDNYSNNICNDYSIKAALRGIPSGVSIETLIETDSSAMDEPTRRSTPRNRRSDNHNDVANTAADSTLRG
ncbi:hypothetical protein BGW39_005686 [Mortierella sp. 14UC]|nr:hypothetical protein BGW39_005686 [Mortierella sp. 14UC]